MAPSEWLSLPTEVTRWYFWYLFCACRGTAKRMELILDSVPATFDLKTGSAQVKRGSSRAVAGAPGRGRGGPAASHPCAPPLATHELLTADSAGLRLRLPAFPLPRGRSRAGIGPHGPCGERLPPACLPPQPLPASRTATAPPYYSSRQPPLPRTAHAPAGSRRAPGRKAFRAL